MSSTEKIPEYKSVDKELMLLMAMELEAKYSVRYVDYSANQYTVPVKLTDKRIGEILNDLSIVEIQLSFKP